MTAGRIGLLLLLAIGAVAVSAHSAGQLLRTLSVPQTARPHGSPPSTGDGSRSGRADRRARRRAAETAPRRKTPRARVFPASRARASDAELFGVSLPLLIAIESAICVVALAGIGGVLTVRRVRRRSRREYALYELHLSPHDESKPQDLEDMIEAIANIVRAFPADRARNGQPFLALELLCETEPSGGLEWRLGVRCEPRAAVGLDAAISAAYPVVPLGHRLGEAPAPAPRPGGLGMPGHVMRFRKQRSFIYPLVAPGDELSSPPLEAIAHAQVAAAAPSVVRFQLTPAPALFEDLARALYRRHENRLVRQERWGLPEGGLTSTLNRAEMANAQRTQNRSLFWLETVVAADEADTCKQLAAAVQARRGENRLRRRWLIARHDLYRRRFATAIPPLLPSPRSLLSAAEAAHLLELPSARMKGVPVRRVAIPRIPMPPEILRANVDAPIATPPDDEPVATNGGRVLEPA
jgi:hypothetical protein